jgi:hypothetical protein
LSRKAHRKGSGTDVTQLWNLPDTTGARGDNASTGRNDVDMEALDARAAELRELLGQLQSAIGEAHGLLKDIRIESRQARRILPMIVSQRINRELERQLAEMSEATKRAMEASVAKVGKEFERLEAIFLGTGKERGSKRSLPEIAEFAQENPGFIESFRREQDAERANSTSRS